jgi:hypothetical protein
VLANSARVPALPARAQSLQITDRDGGAKHQLTVALHAQWAVGSVATVALAFATTPLLPAPALVIQWSLPNGGELLGGDATENLGGVAANQTVNRVRQARFATPGIYEVMAVAGYQPDVAISDLQADGLGDRLLTANRAAPLPLNLRRSRGTDHCLTAYRPG